MMVADKPWLEAIMQVLSDSAEPMHYSEIADEIGKRKLRKSLGATPKNTVNVYLNGTIKDGKELFVKVGPGRFALKTKLEAQPTAQEIEAEAEEEVSAVITSVGMYWRHSEVDWTPKPKILGREQEQADSVDFYNQRGIYMLHDRGKVLYVGRVTDRPLGLRLLEHTKGRLSGRWERFSWFGLREVSDKGVVDEDRKTYSHHDVIVALEAVLIEALEAPQNRRRGDDLNSVEYMQVPRKPDNQKAIMDVLKKMLDNES